MKKLIATISILLIVTSAHAQTYTVERVIDGNTLELTNGEEVRLIGIDTSKMGQEATEFVRSLGLEGKEVILEFDVQEKDKYGRLLAYVSILMSKLRHLHDYKDLSRLELFLNVEIIKKGYATPVTIPPNVKYAELFEKLYQEAREEGRGLWREGLSNNEFSAKDEITGILAKVASDRKTVIGTDIHNKQIWSVNIIEQFGKPIAGSPSIRALSIDDGKVKVVFGKHSYATIDIQTGEASYVGSD